MYYFVIRQTEKGDEIEAWSKIDFYIKDYLTQRLELDKRRKYKIITMREDQIPEALYNKMMNAFESESKEINLICDGLLTITQKNEIYIDDIIDHDMEFLYHNFHYGFKLKNYFKLTDEESEQYDAGMSALENHLNLYMFSEDDEDEEISMSRYDMVRYYIKAGLVD